MTGKIFYTSGTYIYTKIPLQNIQVKELSCLHLANTDAFKIIEIDVCNIGYGSVLKRVMEGKEQIIQYTSQH